MFTISGINKQAAIESALMGLAIGTVITLSLIFIKPSEYKPNFRPREFSNVIEKYIEDIKDNQSLVKKQIDWVVQKKFPYPKMEAFGYGYTYYYKYDFSHYSRLPDYKHLKNTIYVGVPTIDKFKPSAKVFLCDDEWSDMIAVSITLTPKQGGGYTVSDKKQEIIRLPDKMNTGDFCLDRIKSDLTEEYGDAKIKKNSLVGIPNLPTNL